MIKDEYKHSELTSRIIKCAFNVHNVLGNGFQEVIYQRALAIEFEENGIIAVREQEMPLFYKNREIGTRRVDFLIQNEVLVELKAVVKLEDVHFAQAINYLEAFKLPVGLLLNFGTTKVEFRRLMKSPEQLLKGNQKGYHEL